MIDIKNLPEDKQEQYLRDGFKLYKSYPIYHIIMDLFLVLILFFFEVFFNNDIAVLIIFIIIFVHMSFVWGRYYYYLIKFNDKWGGYNER